MIAIYSYSPSGLPKERRESKASKKAVNAYVTSFMRTCVKTFGFENI